MFNRCWQYILNLVFYLSYSLLQVKEINNVTICLQHECPGSYYGFEVVLQYVDLLSSSILYSIFLRQNELCFLCCMLNTQDSVLFTISIFKKLLNTSLIIFSCKILLVFCRLLQYTFSFPNLSGLLLSRTMFFLLKHCLCTDND